MICRPCRAGAIAIILLATSFLPTASAAAQSAAAPCVDLLQRFNEAWQAQADAEKRMGGYQYKGQEYEKELGEYPRYWQEVIDTGRRYLSLCPSMSAVLNAIANGLAYQNDVEGALSILKRCISLDPEHSSCWLDLGDVQERLCRPDEAKEAYERVIEIGGFTELTAIEVKMAKTRLEMQGNREWLEVHGVNCPAEPSGNGGPSGGSDFRKRYGSGFFVNKQGYVLTNNHVVEGCKTLATRGGDALTVIDRRVGSDLALLKAGVKTDNAAIFRGGQPPRAGDTVITFGFPLPEILSSEGNVSSGSLSATSGLQDDVRFIQISAPVQPGNSGGPLFDNSGHVIGVVVAKLDALQVARYTGDLPENVNFAVSWAEVRAFLDEEGVAYLSAPSGKPLETGSIAGKAKLFSVAIECRE